MVVLMALRRIFRTLRCFVPFIFAFYILLSVPEHVPLDQLSVPADLPNLNWVESSPPIEPNSLAAILPVTITSLPRLGDTLAPLLDPMTCVSKILIAYPESMLAPSRAAIHHAVRSSTESDMHPDVSLHPWRGDGDPVAAVLKLALEASTKWLLLLDETGLEGLSDRTRQMLLCPVAADIPVGPRGIIGAPNNRSCAPPSSSALPAAYLLPPFTLAGNSIHDQYDSWAHLGRTISQTRADHLGGVVRSFGDPDSNWCNSGRSHSAAFLPSYQDTPAIQAPLTEDLFTASHRPGTFVFLLPDIDVLYLALRLLCLLNDSRHRIRILLYSDARPVGFVRGTSSRCRLRYETLSHRTEEERVPAAMHDWLDQLGHGADVIFALDEQATQSLKSTSAMVVRIPRDDLIHAHWMGTMTLTEWLNWNTPRIEICVITQDRPRSLERLLFSLTQSRFFGDSANLRINLEQSSDLETLRVAGGYSWAHGSVFIHRRVVHGGLIPAVVESWYPSSNDTYGLLLEDDVELSPLFYAWLKMCILRYRYGEAKHRTTQLFGISLYQQKNIELHPEGRKPFDPRSLFASNRLPHTSTPYLSQIPCSWGAVYFPEHWREFHDYLSARLSETSMEISRIVVPNVRSNNWTKSWKKYFIELVYLRGYVMLYPNYEEFVSLSTNHLEVGSHVKDRPKEKQDAFRLPLMELEESWRLLELPGGTLPPWEALPVVNLTGFMSSLKSISLVSLE